MASSLLHTTDVSQSMFVSKYRQHESFAMERKSLTFDEGEGTATLVAHVPRTADYATGLVLSATVEKPTDEEEAEEYVYPLEREVTSVDLWIGGVMVERRTGMFYRVYDELYRSIEERFSYTALSNFVKEDVPGCRKTLYMPLLLSSFPINMAALTMSDVKVVIRLRHKPPTWATYRLDVQYVYMQERPVPHTHRVQQVQHLEFPLTSSMYDPLMTHTFDVSSFEHPCHTIVVAAAHERRHGAFTGSGVNYEMSEVYAPILSIRLMMDGREIQYEQQGSFFRQSSIFASKRLASAGVYILQFGVDPENGTVNLSKFSSIQLSIRLKKPVQNSNMDDTEGINVTSCTTLHVFALNFNWLEYKDGQAGLMFA